MEPLIWITLPVAAAALVLAIFQWTRSPAPDPSLKALSRLFSREVLRVRLFQEGLALLILLLTWALSLFLRGMGLLDSVTPWALLSGGVCTALAAGSTADLTARNALGIAEQAGKELKSTVQSLQSAGVAAGLEVQALALLHTAGWYCILRFALEYEERRLTQVVMALSLGCAVYALTSGLIGSLLVQGGVLAVPDLPPDAPENPTALIHWAGGNASSFHTLAADSFSVWVCVVSSALALGSGAFPGHGMGEYARALPLAVAAVGTFGSLLGVLVLHNSGELTGPGAVAALLRRGRMTALGLTAVMAAPCSFLLSGSWRCCIALLFGFAAVILLRGLGRWFISSKSLPVWNVVQGSRNGGAFLLVDGFAWGLGGVCLGLLVLVLCLMGGYFSLGGLARPERGLYGAALTGVGLVSALGMELTVGSCGAVASSAVGAARLGNLTEGLAARLEGLAEVYRAAALDFRNWLSGAALLSGVVVCLTVGLRSLVNAQLLALVRVTAGFLVGLLLVVLFSLMVLFAVRRIGQGLGVTSSRRFQKDEFFFYRAYLGIGLGLVLWEVLLMVSALVIIALAGFLLGREAFWGLCLAVTGLAGIVGWWVTAVGLSWTSVQQALTAVDRPERDSVRAARQTGLLVSPLEGALGPALTELILLSGAVTLLASSFP